MGKSEIIIELPGWVEGFIKSQAAVFPAIEDRMRLAIELARENIEHRSGGPFGAAVFERESGKLIAYGVNLVEPLNCSILHAEMVAIAMAQKQLGTFDLGAEKLPAYELLSSTEPCAMCLGAIAWSGVSRIICGARDEDARAIGFDEGDKPDGWVEKLNRRKIAVVRDVLRDSAKKVLQHYANEGGLIYNSDSK